MFQRKEVKKSFLIMILLICIVLPIIVTIILQLERFQISMQNSQMDNMKASQIDFWSDSKVALQGGEPGENTVHAKLYDNNVLVIYGKGSMRNWDPVDLNDPENTDYSPWNRNRKIKKVVITNNVKNIGNAAFFGCTEIEEIWAWNGDVTIGADAFTNTTKLKYLICEPGAKIENYAKNKGLELKNGYNASASYADCVLASYPAQNQITISGIGEMKDDFEIDEGKKEDKTVIAIRGIKNVGKKAFESYINLTTLSVENTVKNIEEHAFQYCISLHTIQSPGNSNNVLWEGLESIEKSAFFYCQSLKKLTFPSSMKMIGNSAFYGCSKLESIIYNGSGEIGDNAFNSCKALKEIYIYGEVTSIGENAFEGCSDELIIYGYAGSYVQDYCNNNNITFVPIDSGEPDPEPEVPVDSSLSGLRVVNPKTEYIEGESFQFADIEIWAQYSIDGSIVHEEIVPNGDVELKDWENLQLGERTITIKYQGYDENPVYYYLVVTVEAKTLTSIAVTTAPTKPEYIEGQNFDKTGMVITAYYNNGTSGVVTGYNVTDGTNLQYGQTSVTISYTDKGVTKTVKQLITVKSRTLTSISITTAPTKTEYIEGQNFNKTGMVITAYYNNGTSSAVTKYSVENGTSLVYGQTSVTISYTERGTTKTTTQAIKVVWDLSYRKDGSVVGELLSDGTLKITGTGKMKEWLAGSKAEYHADEYLTKIKKVQISSGITSIGSRAFKLCTNLVSIEMPNTITIIKNSAFEECTNLQTIEISSSVTSIEDYAFWGCSKLTNITLPSSLTSIGQEVFNNCTNLGTLTIPKNVSSVASKAFLGCSQIVLQEGFENIFKEMFKDCTTLTSITIPSSVITIGDYAFENCTKLVSVTIPEKVTNLGEAIFKGCSKLTEINVDPNNTRYCSENGVVYTKSQNKIIMYPPGNTNTSYTITSKVQSIGNRAFISCNNLTSIRFSGTSNLINIGEGAFGHCTNLKEIEFPESLTTIGKYAFYGCTSLQGVEIFSHVEKIGKDAFLECGNIAIITNKNTAAHTHAKINNVKYFATSYQIIDNYIMIEESKTTYQLFKANVEATTEYKVLNEETNIELGDSTEVNTSNILTVKNKSYIVVTSWDISKDQDESIIATLTPDGVLMISGEGEMKDWTENEKTDFHTNTNREKIQKIKIKGKIKNIGDYAFDNCINLKNGIEMPIMIKKIGDYAFRNCPAAILPKGLEEIGEGAFFGSGLDDGEIPYGVTKIGSKAFMNCKELYSVTIEENVTQIGDYAFGTCVNIITLEILNEKIKLGNEVFWGCNNTIIICKSNTEVHEYLKEQNKKYVAIPYNIYLNYIGGIKTNTTCAQFKETIETNISYNLYDYSYGDYVKDGTVLESGMALWIGDDINYSREYELIVDWDISEAQDGSVGAGLSPDGTLIISGTGKMKNWTSTSNTDYHTEENLSKIQNVVIGSGVQNIGEYAFYGIKNISKITLPETIQDVEKYAFEGCSDLINITVNKDNNVLCSEDGVLYNKEKTKLIKYPEGKMDGIITVTKEVTTIEEDAFNNCEDIIIMTNADSVAYKYAQTKEIIYFATQHEIINNNIIVESSDIKYSMFKSGSRSNREYKIIDSKTSQEISDDTNLKEGYYLLIGEEQCPIKLTTWDISQNEDESIIATLYIKDKTLKISGTGKMKDYDRYFNTAPWHDINSCIENIEIEEGITNIGAGAFYRCTNLVSLNIPKTITSIGNYAFSRCKSLKEFEIPQEISTISQRCFEYCTNLEKIIIPEGITKIDEFAFIGCSKLKIVTIPESVTEIGIQAFRGCSSLEDVILPKSLEIIGDGSGKVFYGVKGPVKYYTNCKIIDDYAADNSQETEFLKLVAEKIEIATNPVKTSYSAGQDFDATGMEVNVVYNEGTRRKVTGYTIVGGTQLFENKGYVTIRYTEDEKTFTIQQEIVVEERTLTGIEITTAPTDTKYVVGQNFDKTGMVITAKYDNGSSDIVLNYEISNDENLTLGQNSINISYTENGVTKTADQTITVVKKELDRIKILTEPIYTVYIEGQNFNSTGMTVVEIYNDGEEKIIEDYTISGGDNLQLDQTNVNVIYTENGKTCTIMQLIKVEVKSLQEIKISAEPTIKEYVEGQSFDKTGMIVIAKYNNGNTEQITNYEVVNGNNLELNQARVTISYTEDGATKTIDQAIMVVEKQLIGIEITKVPNKVNYVEGEDFNSQGMEVTARYNDGSSKIITEYVIIDEYYLKDNQEKVTISYEENRVEKTAEQIITVIPYELSKIEITIEPDKTSYVEGDKFDILGMRITATYSDGTTRIITDYEIINGDSLVLNQESVTISYTENGVTKTAIQEIDVVENSEVIIDKYEVKQDGSIKYLTNIKEKTTISEVIANIKTNGTIEVYRETEKVTNQNILLGTGMTIKIKLSNREINYIAIVTGDLNGDGQVKPSDLSKLKLNLVGRQTLQGAYEKAADLNRDGQIKPSDLSKIKLYLVGRGSL